MTGVSRRGFLGWLVASTATAAALATDPERLLWVPGAKTFFIPELVTPKNIRLATGGEVAALTDGQHYLRIRHGGYPGITVMSEAEFARVGHVAFPHGVQEVHFDNGRVGYLDRQQARATGEVWLAEAVADAERRHQSNQQRIADRARARNVARSVTGVEPAYVWPVLDVQAYRPRRSRSRGRAS